MKEKTKVFITTDGEIDDKCSMIRLLHYTNDLDIRGLVSVNSQWQKDGHTSKWMHELIDLYEADYEKAITHDPNFTHPYELHKVVRTGYESRHGLYMDEPDLYDTPGSDLLLKELISTDLKPLHICMWGSGIMVSYVFKKIKQTCTLDEYDRACTKAKLYYISCQELGYAGGYYMRENHPQVQNIITYQWIGTWNYKPREHQPFEDLMGDEFIANYIKVKGTTLAQAYPGVPSVSEKDGEGGPLRADTGMYISEGDTPSFLHAINHGLKGHLDPRLGNWGGRFKSVYQNVFEDAVDDGKMHFSLAKYTQDIEYDFANRCLWFAKEKDQSSIEYPTLDTEVTNLGNDEYKIKMKTDSNAILEVNVYEEITDAEYELDKIDDVTYMVKLLTAGQFHLVVKTRTKDEIYLCWYDHIVLEKKSMYYAWAENFVSKRKSLDMLGDN